MKFKINPKLFEKYPSLFEAVVVLKDIDNTVKGNDILNILRNEESKIKSELKNKDLGDIPQIAAWRKAFRDFGSDPKSYAASVDALLRRVQKGQKLPDISPLVNLYNYCSIKNKLPFGGEDFSGVVGDMELKYCEGNEKFTPILKKENKPPDKGEIAWVDDAGVTCRKWNWHQCDRTKITEDTKEGYFIIDGIEPTTKEEVKKAAEEFISLAEKHFGAKGEIYWLDKENPEVKVDIETISSQTVKQLTVKQKQKKKKLDYNNWPIPFSDFDNSDSPKYQIREIIHKALMKLGYDQHIKKDDIEVMKPPQEEFGDYSTNVAMILAKHIHKKPDFIAKEILGEINQVDQYDQIDPAGGFINFKISTKHLTDEIQKILNEKDSYGRAKPKKEFRLIVEFGQPNTHKMPHIGHLFSFVIGESISRITGHLGFDVFRANYQGDVGPQVAKCLWAYLKEKPETPDSYREKAMLLQKLYQEGATAYKEDKSAKEEIDTINRKIYDKDPEITKIYKKTREWSIKFYKEFEQMLGVSYDRYYYESETAEPGKQIVEDNIGKVFKKSKGAVIFEGSKYGLHDRVFITKKGTPTYEAKDMALQPIKYKEWPFDFMVIMTAHEQNEYFNVVFKAIEELDSKFKGKLTHLGFGMVQLKSGKISSRLGNIITGVDLADQAISEVEKILKDRKNLAKDEKKEIAEKVGIGAIKYSFLKGNPLQDSVFDFKESISFEGNSGPYLQYTYARAKSIIQQSAISHQPSDNDSCNSTIQQFSANGDLSFGMDWSASGGNNLKDLTLNSEEISLLRTLCKFSEVVRDAGINLAPNLLCNYLFDLAQRFNLFYKKHPVLKAQNSELKAQRLAITKATAQVLKNGLNLLGIEVLEKM